MTPSKTHQTARVTRTTAAYVWGEGNNRTIERGFHRGKRTLSLPTYAGTCNGVAIDAFTVRDLARAALLESVALYMKNRLCAYAMSPHRWRDGFRALYVYRRDRRPHGGFEGCK